MSKPGLTGTFSPETDDVIELACGLHEATRLIDPCPVCTAAKAANAKELAGMVISNGKRASERARIERGRRALEEESMAGSVSKFSEAEQRAAVDRVTAGELISVVATSLGVSPSLVATWRRKFVGVVRPASTRTAQAAKASRVDALLGDVRPARKPRQTPPVAPVSPSTPEAAPMREATPPSVDVVAVIEDLGVSYAIGRVIEALAVGDLDRAATALDRARTRRAA